MKAKEIKTVVLIFIMLLVSIPVLSIETINIATGEYPPWASIDLKHKGFCSQVVKEAFAKEGYNVKFVFLPWKRALEETKKLKYQASSFWFETEDKKKIFHYSDALATEKTAFFFLKTNPMKDWKTLEDLKNYNIGATRGYSYTDEFWKAAEKKIIKVDVANSDEINFRKLFKERIDIFPSGIVTAYELLNKKFNPLLINTLNYHPNILRKSTSHIIFPKEDKNSIKYLNAFNAGLEKLKQDGTYEIYMDNLLKGKYKK